MSNPYEHAGRLASEDVVVQAPMSFAGSAKRIWKITRVDAPAARAVMIVLAVVLVSIAWAAFFAWYCIFGLWLVPYRMSRRSDRNRKRQGFQHREMLTQLEKTQSATMMAALANGAPPPLLTVGAISPDGRYLWDGRSWQPVASPPAPPTIQAPRP
jgi:hypothetical protein